MIRDRIVALRRVRARELVGHPRNWRRHPPAQRVALAGLLREIGYAGALLAREDAQGQLHLIDGHLRAELTPEQEVPVLVLDVTAAEADLLLATFDPVGAMASRDRQAVTTLLKMTLRLRGQPSQTSYVPIANDDLDATQLRDFLAAMLRVAGPHLTRPAVYVWHHALLAAELAEAWAAVDLHLHSQVVWVKPSLGLGAGHYHWRHEVAWYGWFRGHQCPWLGGRDQTTVWEVEPGEGQGLHPTAKPVELFRRPIRNHTEPDAVLYEPFAGSGAQLIAAEELGRRCYALEIEPVYCDVIVRRWEAFTGERAVREGAAPPP